MVKLNTSPKNLPLDINVAKNGQFHVSHSKQLIPWCRMKNSVSQNTAGAGNHNYCTKIRKQLQLVYSTLARHWANDMQTEWLHTLILNLTNTLVNPA